MGIFNNEAKAEKRRKEQEAQEAVAREQEYLRHNFLKRVQEDRRNADTNDETDTPLEKFNRVWDAGTDR